MKRRTRRRDPKLTYELIPRDDEFFGRRIYPMVEDLVAQHHDHLKDARIAVVWCTSWKADVDGKLVLGKCKKASDLDRELAQFDLVILLNRGFWTHRDVTDEQRLALLDHELCHAALKYDTDGEPVEDSRGRKVYRIRKHDIEEFSDVVKRHGIWTHALQEIAEAMRKTALQPFRPCRECEESPGWLAVVLEGERRVTRCPCWLAWAGLRAEVLADELTKSSPSQQPVAH